jgi:hypothetical protein
MKTILLAAAFAALGAIASAETPEETLLVPPYPAATPWKSVTDRTNPMWRMRQWIPADQSEDDVRDVLTEQQFFRRTMTPAEFVQGMFAQYAGQCTNLRVNGPVEHVENGFAVAYAQIYCSRQKGTDKDGDIFLKAIAGTKALYVVQYEIRRPADKNGVGGVVQFSGDQLEAMKALMARQAGANKFLSEQVKLCAAIDAAGTCQPGSATEPPQPATPANPGDVRRLADDVSAQYGFVLGKTTADEVKHKFGKPVVENHNPDGRFVLMFDAPEGKGRMLGALFDSAGNLTAIRLYGAE